MEEFIENLVGKLVIIQRTSCGIGGFGKPFDIVIGELETITGQDCAFKGKYLHINKKSMYNGVVNFSVETLANTAHLAFKDMYEDFFKEYSTENLKNMMLMHLDYSEKAEYEAADEIIKKFFKIE